MTNFFIYFNCTVDKKNHQLRRMEHMDIIVQGVVNGSYYALLALGFALIFGAARIVNLFHTGYFMLGAYFCYAFATIMPLGIAAIVALIAVAVVGYGIFVLIEPIRKKGVAVLIVTIGLAFFAQEVMRLGFGTGNKLMSSFVVGPVFKETGFELMGASITYDRLFVVLISAIMILLLWFFMEKTKTGRAVMAVAQDEEAAQTVGVNPKVVNIVAISLSAILAGVAGMTTTTFTPINNHMWLPPLIKAFAIVILGGLGSVWGSVLAAFALSFAESMANNWIDPSLGTIVFLVVVLIMLVVRPQGILGKPVRF